ncbi:MAG: YIP1 family protein [Longimicrobiales bacterium]
MRETAEAPAPPSFPWPPEENGSIAEAFVRTWREGVFHPTAFFRAMPRTRGIGEALLYYLPVGVVAAGISLFWRVVLGPVDFGGNEALARFARETNTPLQGFLLSPLYLLLLLFVAAAVIHVCLKLLGAAHHGFRTTVRVLCFAYSPALLEIIPRLGGLIATIWMTIIAIIGLREAQETTTGRAAAAVLMPVILLGGFVVFAVLLVAYGLLLQPVN